MRLDILSSVITTPYFFSYQLPRLFPKESPQSFKTQLSRLVKKGLLTRLKRGIYIFPDRDIDELVLASILYQPSYVSLETALHIHGIIPDIPSTLTSVTSITPNTFVTSRGTFSYSRIDKKYYYGYTRITNQDNQLSYSLAEPEKALLDWMYIRKITDFNSLRVDLKVLDKSILSTYAKTYPGWIARNFYE
jgi:hypothetical protein